MKTYKELKKFLNAPTDDPKTLAKKHDVPLNQIKKSLKQGMEVEKEHTKKKMVAREIALDHIGEDPKYYDKLKKIEK